ncbi:MAG: hypothetical protein KBA53_09570 [Thermoclostridium sp.]|nr:hypothetical protein [Thermoclostridium sp.]
MVTICEVKTKHQLKEFIRFPNHLYKDNPNYVPPLLMDEIATLSPKNPAREYCRVVYWLAYRDNQVVGRIAGIINDEYIQKWKNNYARFGWIDFIDDREVSSALFNTVEEWAHRQGMEGIHGPLGFCDLDKEGLLIEGFEEMGSIITMYHFPYYREHIEASGYAKDIDWFEFDITMPEYKPNKILSTIAQRTIQKYGLRILKINKIKDAMPFVPQMFELINTAYENLYGVVPLTERQIKAYTKQYIGFCNPDYISFVMDGENKLAGFALVMPSLSQASRKSGGKLFPFGFIRLLRAIKKNDTLDLYLTAVRPEYKNTGVSAICLEHLTRNAIKNGVKHSIGSPQLETNHAIHSFWRFFDDVRIHRKRRCYLKKFG